MLEFVVIRLNITLGNQSMCIKAFMSSHKEIDENAKKNLVTSKKFTGIGSLFASGVNF